MRLCNLAYRLKGTNEVKQVSFENPQDALLYLIEHDLQRIVGHMPSLKEPERVVIREAAAQGSKADWHEFSHVEVSDG